MCVSFSVCVSLFLSRKHTQAHTLLLFQSLSHVRHFATPWTSALPNPSLSSLCVLKLTSFESMMPSNHLIFCHTHRHMFFHTYKHLYAHKHSLSLSYTHTHTHTHTRTHTHTHISSSSTKMLRLFQALSSHYHEEVAFTPSLEPWGTEESSS